MQWKTMEKQKQKTEPSMSKEEVDELGGQLQNFASEMRTKIADIRNSITESCCISDSRRGLSIEIQSHQSNPKELTKLTLETFHKIRDKNKIKKSSFLN